MMPKTDVEHPAKPAIMDQEQIWVVSDLLHQLLFGLRIDRLETWSEQLAGMPLLDLHILGLVAKRPNVILGEIRHELHIPHSTLSSAINRLEERGLLRRVISQRDRRSYGLKLTRKGQRVQEEHDRVDRMIAVTFMGALDDEGERQILIDLLSKISEWLGQARSEGVNETHRR